MAFVTHVFDNAFATDCIDYCNFLSNDLPVARVSGQKPENQVFEFSTTSDGKSKM